MSRPEDIFGGVTPPSLGALQIDMTGLEAVGLNCNEADTFDLINFDTVAVISVVDLNAGQTITITTVNAAAAPPTFANVIAWPGGAPPEFTANMDTIVLTALSTDEIIGAYTVDQQ